MPKFKPGQWVRVNNGGIYTRYIYRIKKYEEEYEEYELEGFDKPVEEQHLIEWQPEVGEWCWFCNKGYNPCLSTFIGYEYFQYKSLNRINDSYSYFSCCEPFIGELPYLLKEC